jgi:hypothetical protein
MLTPHDASDWFTVKVHLWLSTMRYVDREVYPNG